MSHSFSARRSTFACVKPNRLQPIRCAWCAILAFIGKASLACQTADKYHSRAQPGGTRDFNGLIPISVLPVLAKVQEPVIAGQLTDYLESNKLLSNAQSGFRSKHCTQDVLLKCTDDWQSRRYSHDRFVKGF